jgi:hypothetical protein
VLSVGHRAALDALHTRKIILRKEVAGARIDKQQHGQKGVLLEILGRAASTIVGLEPEALLKNADDPVERALERLRKSSLR